jgi:iron complex outermembrane receptor protein
MHTIAPSCKSLVMRRREPLSEDGAAIRLSQKIKVCFFSVFFILTILHSIPGYTETGGNSKVFKFNIPGQNMAASLVAFSEITGNQLSYPAALVKDIKSKQLSGTYTADQALQKLLAGSGISYRHTDNDAIALAAKESDSAPQTGTTMLKAMTVVGESALDVNDPDNQDYKITNAVTATKTDTPIMETPFSVKVISKQVMQDQQSVRLDQALENVSGVQPSRSAGGIGGGQSFTTIRGFQTTDFYRDGGRFNGSFVVNGPREMANVERIEVLKGPASILYGRMEPGGMVNIVTKKPLATPYYSLQQQFGSFDFYRTTADAAGPVTEDGSLLYRVNLAYENGGSFREFIDNDRVFFAPTVQWNISDKTKANFHMEYQYSKDPFDTGLFAVGTRPVDVPRERNLGEAGTQSESETFIVGFDWSHAFNDNWTLSHRFDAIFLPKADGGPSVYGQGPDPQNCTVASCSVNRITFADQRDDQNYYTTLDLNGKFSTWGLNHSVLIGGDYQRLQHHSDFAWAFSQPIDAYNPVHTGVNADLLSNPNLSGSSNFIEEWGGFYAQDSIELPYHVHLLAGFRYDTVRKSNWSDLNFNFGNPFVQSTNTLLQQEAVNPRFGILYQPIPELSLYGNYVENFGIANGQNADGSSLPPTTAQQWEAGIKTELFDKRFTGTLAWYDITKQNIAVTDPNPASAALGFSQSVGEVRNQGIELDLTGELLPGWKLIGSYSYIDSEITKDIALVNGTVTQGNQGKSLWNVPRNSASLWNTYEFQAGDLRGLIFGAGLIVRDQRQGDNANSFQLPGYATANLMAGYSWKVGRTKLSTQLNVNNLLDKSYYDSAANSRTQGIMPGTPRSFMGSIRVEF